MKPISKISAICSVLLLLGKGQNGLAQRPTPAPYPAQTSINQVRIWEAQAPQTDPARITLRSPLDSFRMVTEYFDGLGRPLQTVQKGFSPAGRDRVALNHYDELGRTALQYLPFTAQTTGGNASLTDGLFKSNAFQQDSAFLRTLFPSENFFYSQHVFEPSPLNRMQQFLPQGNSWVGAGRGITTHYGANTWDDSVRIWGVALPSAPDGYSSYQNRGVYPPGTLYKITETDEQGNRTVTFKNEDGLLILRKVQSQSAATTHHVGWECTYYLYDDLDQLRCVIQPMGVEWLQKTGWDPNFSNGDLINGFAFRYEYDRKGRMIIKKLPSNGRVFMVYDQFDRLCMIQDSVMRVGTPRWLVTAYDHLNRPVQTGIMNNAHPAMSNRSVVQHWQAADAAAVYPAPVSTWPGTQYTELTQTGYDHYGNLPAEAPSLQLMTSNFSGNILTANLGTSPLFAEAVQVGKNFFGLVTWTKVRVLETNNFLYQTNLYDAKGRLIQVKNTNLSGGVDVVTNQYDFSGKLLRTHLLHQKAGANAGSWQVLTINQYDAGGRRTSIQKRSVAPNGSATDRIIARFSYDEMEHLKSKLLGDGLEAINYDYHIRGWMLGANRSFAFNPDSLNGASYFGFDLGYDRTGFNIGTNSRRYNTAYFNGNIAGTVWKSRGDNEIRKFDFVLDRTEKLLRASFSQYSPAQNFDLSEGLDFSVFGITYEDNGNIETMNQRGWTPRGSVTIDSLLYTYFPYGNRLRNVIDRRNDTATWLGDFRSSRNYMTSLGNNKTRTAIDYRYDGNGNINRDLNKDIGTASAEGIRYNHLNLPFQITVNGKGLITYRYDALGRKLQKVVSETVGTTSQSTTTLYLAGEYVNDVLQWLPHEEGRMRFDPAKNTFHYDYFLKDHLGNVRMVLTDERDTVRILPATFESETLAQEDVVFEHVNRSRVARPGDFFNSTSNGSWVQVLRKGTGDTLGVGKLMKIMATDRLHVQVDYFIPAATADNTVGNGVQTLVSGLTTIINGSDVPATAKALFGSTVSTYPTNTALVNFFAPHSPSVSSSLPKAYLNIVFFDEQGRFVQAGSESIQITTTGSAQQIFRVNANARVALKNGWVYIYVSNESRNLVYFDNLRITHQRGAIIEETHYYPFGLTMAGISSRAVGSLENERRFNEGSELNEDLGLRWYETPNRSYDPQLGRFWQVDEFGEIAEEWSPYVFGDNNPILYNDPLGLFKEGPDDVKTLQEVIVRSYSRKQMVDLYWQMRQSGTSMDRVVNNHQRKWLQQYDGIQRHMDRMHQMTREQDMAFLKGAAFVGSFFVPGGALMKLKRAGMLLKLFQGKRGIYATKFVMNTAIQGGVNHEGADIADIMIGTALPSISSVGAQVAVDWKPLTPEGIVPQVALINKNPAQVGVDAFTGLVFYGLGKLPVTSKPLSVSQSNLRDAVYGTSEAVVNNVYQEGLKQ